uniref:Dimeric alpha-beta barrel n=1 Tax=Tetraselmis sp. GSL018 TaxID=582737 RepID=A0A061S0G9_9CHLO|mmetsp:Transcript_13672/g.32389  ORF Transcript_13672/g.32389 Transcript_13672/m.32389 type:complete len:131 (+) Transcript_13672:75-467(+)
MASLLALAFSAGVGYFLGRVSRRRKSKNAWQLLVWKIFKTKQDRDRFLALFEPLARYVREHETGTLAYEVSISDIEPRKILIFERYISKEYFKEVHRTSEAFLAFKDSISQFSFEDEGGHSYIEQDMGTI